MARKSNGPWFWTAKGGWYAWHFGKRVNLRVKGEGNEAEAVRAWHRLMAEEPSPKTEPKPEPKPPTVKELAEAFISDAMARLKPPTIRLYRVHLGAFGEAYGTLQSDAITPQHVTRWMHSLPQGPTTKSMMVRAVGAMYGWAMNNDLAPANPVRKVTKPRGKSRSASAVITDAQHALLLSVATPKQAAVLKVLHATGCRPGEACRISAATLNVAAGVVVLDEHKGDASGKPRLLFLTPDVLAMLSVLAEAYPVGPLLRTRGGNGWDAQSVNGMMRKLGLKVGEKVMPYGYRHGFCTSALAKGVPDAHVAALMGHTSTAMIHRHYSHLTSQATVLREALERVRG